MQERGLDRGWGWGLVGWEVEIFGVAPLCRTRGEVAVRLEWGWDFHMCVGLHSCRQGRSWLGLACGGVHVKLHWHLRLHLHKLIKYRGDVVLLSENDLERRKAQTCQNECKKCVRSIWFQFHGMKKHAVDLDSWMQRTFKMNTRSQRGSVRNDEDRRCWWDDGRHWGPLRSTHHFAANQERRPQ